MAGEAELRELLPKMRFNEEFKKRQAYKYKKRVEAREKEMEIVSGKKRSPAATEKMPKSKKAGSAASTGKKTGDKAVKKKSKSAKKTRAPKLKIANAETGKETLKKKKAKELVAASKKKTKKVAAAPVLSKKSKRASAAGEAVTSGSAQQQQQQSSTPSTSTGSSSTPRSRRAAAAAAASSSSPPPPPLTPTERDRALLAKAIRGDDLLGGEGPTTAVDGAAFVRQDPTLYPDLEFLDEYAEKKHADVVSADQLLENAHHFFKDLGKREQALNRVAKEHIQHLRAVNRRGGDKDGFRYVVPKNVKSVVRNLLASQKAREGVEDPEALIDPRSLVSTFGGDGVAETSDKPVRRSRRKHNRTYSDFYQFQVSKKWTRNAENFLKRSRPNKMLFEAKKHQRSIKNF